MSVEIDQQLVTANVAAMRSRISELAGERSVELMAVTKGFGADAVIAAARAGVGIVGESYAQELEEKWPIVRAELGDAAPRVHFIGGLQRNKVRKIADVVATWQSVDRASIAGEIAKRSEAAEVMVQLNVSGAESQGGCPLADAPALLERCRELGLVVTGAMAIGAQGDDAVVRSSFDRLVDFADAHSLHHRSIGMSGDLELAIAAGSTMVRIGTALFGARPPRGAAAG